MSESKKKIRVEQRGRASVVRFAPLVEFSEQETSAIERELTTVLDVSDISALVINFTGVALISSHMLGVLVRLRNLARKRKIEVQLAELTEINLRLFQLTRLNNLFRIYASEDEALAAAA